MYGKDHLSHASNIIDLITVISFTFEECQVLYKPSCRGNRKIWNRLSLEQIVSRAHFVLSPVEKVCFNHRPVSDMLSS